MNQHPVTTRLRVLQLPTTYLEFTVEAVTPLELDEYSGASLRGNFFNAILGAFLYEQKRSHLCRLHPT